MHPATRVPSPLLSRPDWSHSSVAVLLPCSPVPVACMQLITHRVCSVCASAPTGHLCPCRLRPQAGCAFLLPPVALTALAAPSSGAVTLKRVQPFSACTGVWNLPNFSVPAQLSFCPTLVSEVGHLAPAAPHDLAMAHRLAGTLGASPCDAPTPQTTSGASTASCAATPLSLIN